MQRYHLHHKAKVDINLHIAFLLVNGRINQQNQILTCKASSFQTICTMLWCMPSNHRCTWREGQCCTFTIISSWHHNEDIFEESYKSKCPEDEGKHPINLFIIPMKAQLPREGRLVDIERGGTEVTINHPKTLISQCENSGTWYPLHILIQDIRIVNRNFKYQSERTKIKKHQAVSSITWVVPWIQQLAEINDPVLDIIFPFSSVWNAH